MEIMITVEVAILVALLGGTIIVDTIFVFTGHDDDEDSFSALSRAFAGLSPFWPLTWGLLAGRFFHWWGPDTDYQMDQPMGVIIAGSIIAMIVVLFLITSLAGANVWKPVRSNFGIPGMFVFGYFLGATLWPVETLPIDFI